MKQTESNPLLKALAQSDAGPHPDAGMLTAYAEDALLPRERESVLAHLAHCGKCRQILHLSGEAVEEPQTTRPLLVVRRKRAVWRVAVPLMAAAAMIAVVTTFVVRSGMDRPAPNVAVATMSTAVQSVQPATQTPTPQPPNKTDKTEQKRPMRKAAPPAVVSVPAAAPPPPVSAEANAAPGEGRQAEVRPSPPFDSSIATAQMKARAAGASSAIANSPAVRGLTQARVDSIAKARWRLNEQGQPERAFGSSPWQPVPPEGSTRMEAISVFGGEVWTGGEKTHLFRSNDNGTTWRLVNLPEKSGTAHTIAHIRFISAQEITIEAADGTTWMTTDGGGSWK